MKKQLLKILSIKKSFIFSMALCSCLLGIGENAFAQPTIAWQRSLGGNNNDQVNPAGGISYREQIAHTTGGGTIFAVSSYSNDGDVTGHHGTNFFSDIWVVKMDSAGYIDWQKSLGGTSDDDATSIMQTADGGYIISATTTSTDGDVPNDPATVNGGAWIIKLNASGNIVWNFVFGGSDYDGINSIKQTADGGYILSGTSSSTDGDVVGLHPSLPWSTYTTNDLWLVKLNSTGIIQWQKCLGGSRNDIGNGINQTADHGYIISGTTNSDDFDISANTDTTVFNAWMVKTDSLGNIQWEKTKGALSNTPEFAYEVHQTYDGGYIWGIYSFVDPGPLQGDVLHPIGGGDFWVIKLNSTGNEQWQWCYGGTSVETFRSIKPAGNLSTPGAEGYILTGWTLSTDSMVTNNYGGFGDVWVIKIDTAGILQWQKSYGGSGRDEPSGIVQHPDGSIYVICETTSNDHDVSGHHGPLTNQDIWLLKLNGAPLGVEENMYNKANVNVYPNPVSTAANIVFNVEKTEKVSIKIFNMLGVEIKNIYSRELSAGTHKMEWQIESNIESGIYFVKIEGAHFQSLEKISILR
ncbi:MAG: T9SS type A sorting domain-containing protein [Bacteroidetes bacterium]|nr:T9SS type A sorting domain-containing protein [Bacteroidota bacterium]